MPAPKQLLKKSAEIFLKFLVRLKLRRINPKIIGITGSIGKTSAKEAVYEVLKTRWSVYRSKKSLNTEIGLLLAVLEQESGFSSPLKWFFIFLSALVNAFLGKKYDFLVLEYGADKPGDISHLISMVKPDVGIITKIARVHQDAGQFKNIDEIFEEKKKLAVCLGKKDCAILNGDDDYLKRLDNGLEAKTFWFNGKDIYASNSTNALDGFSAEIHAQNKTVRATFPILGSYHKNVILPALLCGILNGVPLEQGIKALQSFKLPPGRMSFIKGKNGSAILDSSYNASPETVAQAMNLLYELPAKRKIAVLGNMNELGDYAEKGHKEAAEHVGNWLYMLITVGEFAKITAEEALKKGFPQSRIKTFAKAEEAAEFLLSEKILNGDLILLKGSQNRVRLERAVKMLMLHPEKAKTLLCRQETEWRHIR